MLEQIANEVSNRSSKKQADYLSEIKQAVKEVTIDYDEPVDQEQIQELDDLHYFQPDEKGINHEELFSYLDREKKEDNAFEYEDWSDAEEEKAPMTHKEAQQFVAEVQASVALRDGKQYSPKDKERFHWYQMLNPAELMIYHDLGDIRTAEIDYANLPI